MSTQKIHFAQNLQNLRVRYGLTQEAMARNLGITRSRLASYETGSVEPNLHMLVHIAEYMNISLDELIKKEIPV